MGDMAGGFSPATSAAVVLVGLTALVALANGVLRLLDRFREQPPPSATYVRISDFLEHRSQVQAQLAARQAQRDADRAEVQRQIEAVRTQIHEDFRQVHNRIDDLPSQMVAILKNTGALK